MEVSDTAWDLVNKRDMTRGILATADSEGKVNAAVYGSLQLSDRGTMTMVMGDTRSLANLKQNPNAAFVVTKGESLQDADGVRVYLRVKEIVEEGPVLDKGRQMIAEVVNPETAETMKAFVSFEVTGTRPLMDMGGGE